MLFRMITPRISKSGSIVHRKGIPEAVRADYQRLYGQRWEAKLTLPAGMKRQEAKVRISEWTAEVESRIAAIRAAQRGEGQSLTQRQAFAVAGEWYVWFVPRHEENPGTVELSPWQLFEAWVKARQPAPSGVTRWRVVFLDLERHFASKSADEISEDDAREWSRQLVTTERSARTVNDVWLTAARTVFAWAQEGRLITSNPLKGMRVTESKRVKHRETDAFMREEWRTILTTALAVGTPRTNFQGAQRWVPWLCAYSGARPGEITQLRGMDIQKREHHQDGQATNGAAALASDRAGISRVREVAWKGAAVLRSGRAAKFI
jgi:integrase